MKSKKVISVLLILVFVLQMLPLKQAVRSFCFGKYTTEEIVDINDAAAKKINIADEDYQFLSDHLYFLHATLSVNNTFSGLYSTKLPFYLADDVVKPPPNGMIG